jgi:hypothetical protein
MDGFQLLVAGVLAIYAVHRVARWMHRRGWIRWQMPRGTSSQLGNAVMGVQTIFQPQIREVLEARLEEGQEEDDSGDPPDPGDDPQETMKDGSAPEIRRPGGVRQKNN